MEMVWFVIARLREHYNVVNKKRDKLNFELEDADEESGDEEELEELDE
jgi:hypothetical protein